MLHGRIIFWRNTIAAEDVETGMPPCGKHGDHHLRDLPLVQQHPEHLVPEDGLQLFQLQRRGDAEHTSRSVETAVRHEDVAVGIEAEEVSESLHGDDGAGDGIILRDRLLEKHLQGFPGAAAKIGKKLPIVEKVTPQHLRDAEYEMPVRNLLEDIYAQPFAEFHDTLLMTGGTEMAALAGKGQQVSVLASMRIFLPCCWARLTAVCPEVCHTRPAARL